jgi:hypothetical protein
MRYRKANHHRSDRPAAGIPGSLPGRAREADHILEQSLTLARHETPAPASAFDSLRALVESRATRRPEKENSIMLGFKYLLASNRKLSLAVVTSALVLAFITLVPFEYQRTIGYEATYASADPASRVNPTELATVLKGLGYRDIEIRVAKESAGERCTIKGLPSRSAVREATAVLAGMTGFEGEPSVKPMVETVSGSLYAQVACELRAADFDFNFEGKTDEEIKSMILERLAAQGCANANVTVDRIGTSTSGEPRLKITVRMGESGAGGVKCSLDDLNLDDLDIQDKTKTDAEVKALIEQRLAARGVTDVQVTVTTNADGRREAMLMKKKDCR